MCEFGNALEWVGLVGLKPEQVEFATRVTGCVQNLPARVLPKFPGAVMLRWRIFSASRRAVQFLTRVRIFLTTAHAPQI